MWSKDSLGSRSCPFYCPLRVWYWLTTCYAFWVSHVFVCVMKMIDWKRPKVGIIHNPPMFTLSFLWMEVGHMNGKMSWNKKRMEWNGRWERVVEDGKKPLKGFKWRIQRVEFWSEHQFYKSTNLFKWWPFEIYYNSFFY